MPAGGFTCLVETSGCGKSMLLNLAAGLDQPTSGELRVAGRAALMFQDSAQFPWLTVAANVELALRLRGAPKRERRSRAAELLAAVHLDHFMDEPFGALDAGTRDLLHADLERLWGERDLTILFVTHNVAEADRLADRVLVLSCRPGRVLKTVDVEVDRPRRIESPRSPPSPPTSPRSYGRRCAPMAVEERELAEQLHGLDVLDAPQTPGRPLLARVWAGPDRSWPPW